MDLQFSARTTEMVKQRVWRAIGVLREVGEIRGPALRARLGIDERQFRTLINSLVATGLVENRRDLGWHQPTLYVWHEPEVDEPIRIYTGGSDCVRPDRISLNRQRLAKMTRRKCLMCGGMFPSSGIGERICRPCKGRPEWKAGQDWQGI